ncbi:hypothetical protein D3C81_1425270 [compost metagenome]
MIIKLNNQTYRIDKIPAIPAKELLSEKLAADMSALRQYIFVKDGRDWVALSDDTVVVELVENWEVLTQLELTSYEQNYGFLAAWKTATVPASMAAKFVAAESKHSDPVVSALVSSGLATYKELREDYSLEEAFKLLDILTVKKINEHRAQEAANRK